MAPQAVNVGVRRSYAFAYCPECNGRIPVHATLCGHCATDLLRDPRAPRRTGSNLQSLATVLFLLVAVGASGFTSLRLFERAARPQQPATATIAQQHMLSAVENRRERRRACQLVIGEFEGVGHRAACDKLASELPDWQRRVRACLTVDMIRSPRELRAASDRFYSAYRRCGE